METRFHAMETRCHAMETRFHAMETTITTTCDATEIQLKTEIANSTKDTQDILNDAYRKTEENIKELQRQNQEQFEALRKGQDTLLKGQKSTDARVKQTLDEVTLLRKDLRAQKTRNLRLEKRIRVERRKATRRHASLHVHTLG